MNNFKELKVWQKGVDLAVAVYDMTGSFPSSERFNLTSQMQKAAVSIPSNIAEGCGRHTDAAMLQFLAVSLGSAYELETQMIIAQRLGYVEAASFNTLQQQTNEVQKMTYSLMTRFTKS